MLGAAAGDWSEPAAEPGLHREVAEVALGGNHDVLPLQAAEWLVWQIQKEFRSKEDGETLPHDLFVAREIEIEGIQELEAPPTFVEVWDREKIETFRDDWVSLQTDPLEDIDQELRHAIGKHFRESL